MRRGLPLRRVLLILTGIVVLVAACGDDSVDVATTAPPDPGSNKAVLGAGPFPVADLNFVVRPDGTDPGLLTYHLACQGDTATLTGDPAPGSAETMCLALDNSQVQLLLTEPPTDRFCTEIYGGPETATVTGSLGGDPVDTEIGRNNGCGISDWDLLTPLLPVPD